MLTLKLARIALIASVALVGAISPQPNAQAQGKGRVYELRTYTTYEGKLDDLLTRFRDHTIKIFDSHGMTSIGYWVPSILRARRTR